MTLASTLSIAGERGSLAKRFAELGLDGQVLAKTGTLATATALSGYVISDVDPASYATFSIIINGELASTCENLEQEVVLLLADFPDAPDVSQLDPLEPIDS
ncbi:MAG: D-alanyl-D-alanine carboxypeptidase [Acidimicrobiales bacterium]